MRITRCFNGSYPVTHPVSERLICEIVQRSIYILRGNSLSQLRKFAFIQASFYRIGFDSCRPVLIACPVKMTGSVIQYGIEMDCAGNIFGQCNGYITAVNGCQFVIPRLRRCIDVRVCITDFVIHRVRRSDRIIGPVIIGRAHQPVRFWFGNRVDRKSYFRMITFSHSSVIGMDIFGVHPMCSLKPYPV